MVEEFLTAPMHLPSLQTEPRASYHTCGAPASTAGT
jgi:hypothetical protein